VKIKFVNIITKRNWDKKRITYQGSYSRFCSLQNWRRRRPNSHCEICRWPCATG